MTALLDLNDPNCLRVDEEFPPATDWPADPDAVPLRTRIKLYVGTLAVLGFLVVLSFWWLPAGFIVGGLFGAVFALRVKVDLRPQWPM